MNGTPRRGQGLLGQGLLGQGLLGQGPGSQRMLRGARALRLHHGLLIEAQRGSGKSMAARELAKALLCEADDPEQACGRCPGCGQVASGNHADLHLIGVAEDKQDISIDQIRALQIVLARRAVVGRARVVILDPADRLTEQGQNALLKTLEEPGSNTFLLLPTSRPERVLPTVLSRVSRLRLRPLAADAVADQLGRLGIGDAMSRPRAAGLSAGSLGVAVELIESGVIERHQHLVGMVDRPNEMSSVARARALLEGATGRLEADHRARLVLWCARQWAGQSLRAALADTHSRAYVAGGFEPWNAILESLLDAEADLDLRIGAEQALCFALLRIQRELGLVLGPRG